MTDIQWILVRNIVYVQGVRKSNRVACDMEPLDECALSECHKTSSSYKKPLAGASGGMRYDRGEAYIMLARSFCVQ